MIYGYCDNIEWWQIVLLFMYYCWPVIIIVLGIIIFLIVLKIVKNIKSKNENNKAEVNLENDRANDFFSNDDI